MDNKDIGAPVAKVLSLWGVVGFATWADAASFASMIAYILGAIWSFLLISEWSWKKIWRPLFEARGWIKPKPHLVLTAREWADKLADQESDRAPL